MKASAELSNELAPLVITSMTDRVEEKLLNYITKKRFKIGDSLPTEAELGEALGVSRTIIREALSRLRMLGLIESRKKRGMILAEPDILSGLERILNPNILGMVTRKELFELRLVLEVGLADLLFKRKTRDDLQKLAEIVKKEESAKTVAERIRCDIEFHAKLYKIAGNQTLQRFQSILLSVFEYVVEYESKLDHTSVGSVRHKDLLRILERGTVEDFTHGMRKHLQPHLQHL